MAACPLEDEQVDMDSSMELKEKIKAIRAKIQSLKKSVGKGDKKRRKEVNLEIAQLENEIQSLRQTTSTEPHEDSSRIEEDRLVQQMTSLNKTSKSKAQKKRDNKARKIMEREKRINEGTVCEEDTTGGQEMSQLELLLEPLRLTIKDITPDGNCLYSAIMDQLAVKKGLKQMNALEVRSKCAQYIRTHPDDFISFITNPDTGDICTADEFEDYCDNVENPSVWGGQVEIVALSHVFKCPVTVHQAYAPSIVTGEDNYSSDDMIHLSYHQHLYTLGNHYNSVVPITD